LDSFINELLDKGFADRQLRLDYVQDLIVKNKSISVFTSPNAYYNEPGAVFSYLPGDYKHLLSSRAKVRPAVDCDALVSASEDYVQTFHFLKLATNLSTPDYYTKVELIKINADQSETLIATVSMPVKETEDIYLIIKNLLYQANKGSNTVEYYWEKFSNGDRQGEIKLGQIIIKDDSIPAPTVSFGYKLVTYDADGLAVDNEIFETFQAYTVKNWTVDSLAELDTGDYASTVLLDNQEVYKRKDNVFFLPKVQEPHSNVSDGILTTYYGSNFIVENLMIDYIRVPQPIALDLEQGCELSESGSRIVANRAIEYLKLLIENPNYKEVLGHNEIREQK